ncbi:hypothetical protein RHE_CH02922 [Rhizobium etli CFN 42]|uniref:Uncharacterized protein n=1 Tax=Rhizobium etli (strain ATCC 51251 / DSM 11541 / JCM 21823 / NBRC 15573 / CFN 42) TaxID=347834 RepID=Q2K647_RHIEC|nr:hypothetical protein [Rhizobium etli]ABC91689.1 hypothetical protein RHE_CH02922 [Rhizobium etli CFN 42]
MAKKPEDQQRRVYVLPRDLVERIAQYQQMGGFASEVEVVRSLLTEALTKIDSTATLLERVRTKFKTLPNASMVAKEVLAGHPLVTKIEFMGDEVEFWLHGRQDLIAIRNGQGGTSEVSVSHEPNGVGHFKLDYAGRLLLEEEKGWAVLGPSILAQRETERQATT